MESRGKSIEASPFQVWFWPVTQWGPQHLSRKFFSMKYMGKITVLLRRAVVVIPFPVPTSVAPLVFCYQIFLAVSTFCSPKTRRPRDCPHSTAPYWLPTVLISAFVPVSPWGSPSCKTFISNSCAWILSTFIPSIFWQGFSVYPWLFWNSIDQASNSQDISVSTWVLGIKVWATPTRLSFILFPPRFMSVLLSCTHTF